MSDKANKILVIYQTLCAVFIIVVGRLFQVPKLSHPVI